MACDAAECVDLKASSLAILVSGLGFRNKGWDVWVQDSGIRGGRLGLRIQEQGVVEGIEPIDDLNRWGLQLEVSGSGLRFSGSLLPDGRQTGWEVGVLDSEIIRGAGSRLMR